MKSLANARGMGWAAVRVALFAALLLLAAGTSQADRDGGRGSWRGNRGHGGGGERRSAEVRGRAYRGGDRGAIGGGEVRHRGGDGGGYGGGNRHYRSGGRVYGGGGGYGGGGRVYAGGGGHWGGGSYYGGRAYAYPRQRVYYGGDPYCYGRVPYYRSSVGYYGYPYFRPRTVVHLGVGIGLPYYCPPAYRAHVEPYPIEEESGDGIEVANEPPAGCYYYDRFCDRQFSNLDDYTDHLENEHHEQTIEIIQKDSGDKLRTLEFVDGYWSVQK